MILGKQSIDGDNNQTGQMLGALAGMPQGTFASQIKVEDGKLTVIREVDGGMQTLSLNLPAIVTTDLRLNEPRYASLPNIMKAKKKPLDVLAITDLVPAPKGKAIEVVKHESPQPRQKGVMVETVDELIEILKDKGLAS